MKTKPNWLEQNPVDYYNINHLSDAVKILLSKDKTLFYDDKNKTISKKTNPKDSEALILVKERYIEVLGENNLGLQPELPYSAFQLLVKFRFNNNFKGAFNYVGLTYMDMNFPYIRVGTDYFKVVIKTDRFNIEREQLIRWKKEEIKQDYGKDMLTRVNVYDDFIISPNNFKHKKTVKSFYNLYSPFPHKPKKFVSEKDIKWSLELMKHIFGNHFELGIKYLKILFENPKQALPILVLISEERSTGKSTFVDWLSIIFGGNMVIINPEDISSSFNSSYATKNIIAIEESRFDSIQATEKLKALATQKTLLVNTKFVNPYNTPFYGKLIITSNDEQKFSKVDEAEIRYWVRKVPTLKGKANHNILEDLTKEIPYFLSYLQEQEDVDFTKSRQVFTPEEIETKALKVVKKESKPELQKEIEMMLDDYCMNHTSEKELYFLPSDLKTVWFKNQANYSRNYISKILKVFMKLGRAGDNKRFTPTFDNTVVTKVGNYFIYPNKYADEDSINDLEVIDPALVMPNGEESGVPF